MQCPRCGVSLFAELNTCRDCGWLLSKPYDSGNTAGHEVTVDSPQPSAPDFPLNGKRPLGVNPQGKPWQQRLWGPLVLPDRLRRRRRRAHARAAEALAALSPEAYFAPRPRALECLEMPLVQTELDFDSAELEEEALAARRVAPLGPRLRAGLFDAALIISASAGFFGLFALLGGQLGLARRDLLIYGLATFALACLYFSLFNSLGGQTPGMQRYELTVVRFDGGPLAPRDARLRAFGYIVSTGSLLLGFLWAIFDESHLTWHDRISRTLITSLPTHGPKPVD